MKSAKFLFIALFLTSIAATATPTTEGDLDYLAIEKAPVVAPVQEKAPVASPVPGLRDDVIEQGETTTEPVEKPI